MRPGLVFLVFCFFAGATHPAFATDKEDKAAPPSIDLKRLDRIDDVVKAAMDHGDMPGAVVLVVHRGEVVFRKAYGLRAKKPAEVAMTCDTVFDMASLTKPLATATSMMILLEQGKFKLSDKVARYLPEFGKNGKDKITIEQLLVHTSGLTADNPEADYHDGRAKSFERIYQLKPEAEPGSRFRYSDVGYIVLGELVEHLSKSPLDAFAEKNVFAPLGMTETRFKIGERLRERSAPNDKRDGKWIQGEVHDPRAFGLGGVAGHAGLFSTADDLAKYALMLLGGGEFKGRRIISPLTLRAMTTPREVHGNQLRGLGWDIDTAFSSNRGELFSRGEGFGHTGFTGTSLWIDPASQTAVIVLSNRLHPDGKGKALRIRSQVATLVAASLLGSPAFVPQHLQARETVLTGIDVLEKEKYFRLKGRKIGLVTNPLARKRKECRP